MTLADDLRAIPIKTIWRVTAGVVAVFVAISAAIGLGGPGASINSVAGYTLPLTVGFAAIAFALISGHCDGIPAPWLVLGAGVILWVSGTVAGMLGFAGMSFGELKLGSPNQVLGSVLEVYDNAYGWPLMICALAIGVASAIQLERWLSAETRVL